MQATTWRWTRLVLMAVFTLALLPASASAISYDDDAIKSTTITAPADPTFDITDDVFDRGDDEGDILVKGTAVIDPAWLAENTDAEDSPGYVDLRCYRDGDYDSIDEATVNRDGTFEERVYAGELDNGTCRLRAIPNDDNDLVDLEKFAGPVMAVTGYDTFSLCYFICRAARGSLGLQEIASYAAYTEQREGTWSITPAGECAVDYSDVYSGSSFRELDATVFDCAGGLTNDDDWDDLQMTVDGMAGFPVNAGLADILDVTPGSLLGLSEATVNAANGNFDLGEDQKIRLCADEDGLLPNHPDYDGCDEAVESGITLERDVRTGSEGRQVTLTDTFTNTSSSPKELKTGYLTDSYDEDDNYRDHESVDAPRKYGVGDDAPTERDTFDIETFDRSPATITIDQSAVEEFDFGVPCSPFPMCLIFGGINLAYADGGETARSAEERLCCFDDDYYSQEAVAGATTYMPAPDRAVWSDDDEYTALYERTLAPGESLKISQTLTQGVSLDEVQDLALQAEDSSGSPVVEITSPGVGTVTSNDSVVVTGKAVDETGIDSLTVNGQAVSVNNDGAWSTMVNLTPGVNTITAIAKDAAGHEGRAGRVVGFVPQSPLSGTGAGAGQGGATGALPTCLVPRVARRTLLSGQGAIVRAGCAVGTLKKKSSNRIAKGRIIQQSSQAGTRLPIGSKVNLVVSTGKAVAKKAKSKSKRRSAKSAKRRAAKRR